MQKNNNDYNVGTLLKTGKSRSIFDGKLTWKENFEHIQNKCKM